MQKILSLIKERASNRLDKISWLKRLGEQMVDICTLGFGTEFFMTPDSSLLLETYNVRKGTRGKAVFYQKFSNHNLMLEAVLPGLFVDKEGTYWDVPLSMAIDLASIVSDSSLSYHLCLQHNSGQPKQFRGNDKCEAPLFLLPGLCAKAAVSIKKTVDIWREKNGKKLKMVQPYDILLSEPHISGLGIIVAVASASLGENSSRLSLRENFQNCKSFRLCAQKNNFGLLGDLFGTVSFSAQHGNFQRLFLDLTRVNARLDIPSGSVFLYSVARLAQQIYNSRQPDPELLRAICPDLRVSFQQQIIGPFSFRVDSRVQLDSLNKDYSSCFKESVFAIDWALKVLGSAKASFWYSPKQQEAMVELRFFES